MRSRKTSLTFENVALYYFHKQYFLASISKNGMTKYTNELVLRHLVRDSVVIFIAPCLTPLKLYKHNSGITSWI